MRPASLLLVAGITLWPPAMAVNQPAELPSTLRTHLNEDRFGIVTSIRGLPLGVRDELQKLFASGTLDIAEPGAPFRATDAAASTLPSRRLVFAGCAPDHHCLIYYERSGAPPSWRVAAFHWTPAATRLEWGGVAPGGLRTIDDVKKAMLSGAIKAPAGSW